MFIGLCVRWTKRDRDEWSDIAQWKKVITDSQYNMRQFLIITLDIWEIYANNLNN